MISVSLRPNRHIFKIPPAWIPPELTTEVYREIFATPQYLWAFANSYFVAIGVTIASLALATLAAYSFSRFEYRGSRLIQFFIAQGESLAYVRDQLGHASIQLTVDTYGHLIPGANRQAVDRLDDGPEDDRPPGVQEPTAPYRRTRGRRLRGAI